MLVEPITQDRSAICRAILDDLPDWFGHAPSKAAYAAAADHLPMLGCSIDGAIVGFVSLKAQTVAALDLFVLGVRRHAQSRGYGRMLIEGAARYALDHGYRCLTVKTLAASHPDPFYAGTRAFYEAMGFWPIEVFNDLWGADTPCLLMVKPLTLSATGPTR